jgi:signal transduction histidine kinase
VRTQEAKTSPVGGLGLGLFITKGLIEAQGGKIWAESVQGDKTSFHFTLPISAEILHQKSDPQMKSSADSKLEFNSLKI